MDKNALWEGLKRDLKGTKDLIKKYPLMFFGLVVGLPLASLYGPITIASTIVYYQDGPSRTYVELSNASEICRKYEPLKNKSGKLEGITLTVGGINHAVRCVEGTQPTLEFRTEERIPFLDYLRKNMLLE